MKFSRYIFILFLVCLTCNTFARQYSDSLSLPPILSDHMVLQQQSQVRFWGKAKANAVVRVSTSWNKSAYRTKSDENGNWQVEVETAAAGGPYEVEISSCRESVLLSDVLLGEVWLCGGQSNMDITFRGLLNQPIADANKEILDSNYPELRLCTVKKNSSFTPKEDCEAVWDKSSPESAVKFSAVGFMFGRLLHRQENVPVGIISCSWGGSSVEAWMGRENVLRFAGVQIPESLEDKSRCNITPTMLFNAMIHPICRYVIRGCIFYQGEANVWWPEDYLQRFPAMVSEWRSLWGYEFPFYYAQIAPYSYECNGWTSSQRQVAAFREAQYECLSVIPNSGIISTADIGAEYTIHPEDKQSVAERFYYMAAHNCYGHSKLESVGPVYKNFTVDGSEAVVEFSHSYWGLTSHGEELSGFELAGEDRVFYPARAYVKGRGTVRVHCDKVPAPVAVRYCFSNYHQANMYNNFGLPAYPFRTDRWDDWKSSESLVKY